MKTPSVQVHRNGAAKAAKSQAKTSRRKPENVRIVINDEAGKVFADFEIPQAFHAAILRDAKAKGIGLQQWIENSVREKIKSATAQNDNVSLLFFSENEGSSLARADLTPAQFAAIQRGASEKGISLEQFLKKGILQMLDLMDYSIWELESAQYQSNALLELLAHALVSEGGPDWRQSLGAGVVELVTTTTRRLKSAFDETHDAVTRQFSIVPFDSVKGGAL